jgi:hypothetical protein
MQTDYNERDTERTRAAERSSAGRQTTSLAGLPSPALSEPAASAPATKRNNRIGLALVGLGFLVLLGRVFDLPRLELEGGFVIFTIASCFLFFAFWKHVYGLFIPGAILTGISLGVTFADLTDGVSIVWGMALAFMAIRVLGRSLFGVNSNWGIYPAIPLFAVGCIIALVNAGPILGFGVIWLPLLLVAAGLYLGFVRKTA